ncbi:hypothetical protein F7725_027128 [Dissostichus mawsoni]|uniref:Solute carrier family 10 member 4 n=1 Tax=Dissostichus mawsoni TaxID=36200 RepID=A0A7J5XC38_DISMA|nr:hypothetical protein F7725_027128 [Dissostichus mawsoni]
MEMESSSLLPGLAHFLSDTLWRAAGSPEAPRGAIMVPEGSSSASEADFMASRPQDLEIPAFWDSPLSHGINVFVGLVLCFTMLGLGCTVDVSALGEQVRRPVGVLLAIICQFVIMPLVAFLLALAFSLDDVAAMAVLICGCCPGGNLSNILSLLMHGDMNLSRAWINTPVVNLMPFGAIILTLCSTLIPIGLGVLLRYRNSRVADIVLKVSLWSLLLLLLLLLLLYYPPPLSPSRSRSGLLVTLLLLLLQGHWRFTGSRTEACFLRGLGRSSFSLGVCGRRSCRDTEYYK